MESLCLTVLLAVVGNVSISSTFQRVESTNVNGLRLNTVLFPLVQLSSEWKECGFLHSRFGIHIVSISSTFQRVERSVDGRSVTTSAVTFPLVQLSSEWKGCGRGKYQGWSTKFPLVQLSSEWKGWNITFPSWDTIVSISSTFQRVESNTINQLIS